MIWTAQRCRCHTEWRLLLPNGALPEFFGCFTAPNAVRQPKNPHALQENGQTGARLLVWAQTQPLCVDTGRNSERRGAAGRVGGRFAKKTVSDTENFADLCLEALP